MATRYRFGDSEISHFITFAVVNWIDALSRPSYKDIVVESLKYCQLEKGLRLHAWIIMSNHVHLIASARRWFKCSNGSLKSNMIAGLRPATGLCC